MNVTQLNPDSPENVLKRISKCISSPPENSRVFTLTPEICEQLLTLYNKGNRPKKPRNIDRYAADMAAQDWALTGDTIKFSRTGVLRDGQNRLMACAKSGVPFTTHIVFGVEDDYFDRMDVGKVRDGSDVLSMMGVSNSRIVAGAVRWVYLFDEGRIKLRDTLQPSMIKRLFNERYSDLPDVIPQAQRIYRAAEQPPSMVAALLYLFNRINPDKSREFADAWEAGQWTGKFKAIGLMQGHLAWLKSQSQGRVHDTVRAALIVKAWNLFVSGRVGRKNEMQWTIGEDFPEIKG